MSSAAQRIAELLKAGGKIRGYKRAVYRPGPGKILDHYARQYLDCMAADLFEVSSACVDQADNVVAALKQGSEGHGPDQIVSILADDAFHLLDKAAETTPPAPPPA